MSNGVEVHNKDGLILCWREPPLFQIMAQRTFCINFSSQYSWSKSTMDTMMISKEISLFYNGGNTSQ